MGSNGIPKRWRGGLKLEQNRVERTRGHHDFKGKFGPEKKKNPEDKIVFVGRFLDTPRPSWGQG